jgi:hypothetical protein
MASGLLASRDPSARVVRRAACPMLSTDTFVGSSFTRQHPFKYLATALYLLARIKCGWLIEFECYGYART